MSYDSRKDTQAHIEKVIELGIPIVNKLNNRLYAHDASKLGKYEKTIFDEFTPKLKNTTYGSEEYKEYLKDMGIALEHHYEMNSHHPEHYENGIKDMDLVDLCEMIIDWKAASMRHADGDILKSIEMNQSRFNYSDELKGILINTVERFLK